MLRVYGAPEDDSSSAGVRPLDYGRLMTSRILATSALTA